MANDSSADLRAAQLTDETIEALLRDEELSPLEPEAQQLLQHLLTLHQPSVPAGLEALIQRRLDEAVANIDGGIALWGPRLVVGALGATFLGQAVLNVVAGEWLARFLRLGYEPHLYHESGIAYGALAIGALIGAFRPKHLIVSVTTAVPAGLLLGIFGLTELPHSPNPAAELFHLLQATLAGLVLTAWLRRRPG